MNLAPHEQSGYRYDRCVDSLQAAIHFMVKIVWPKCLPVARAARPYFSRQLCVCLTSFAGITNNPKTATALAAKCRSHLLPVMMPGQLLTFPSPQHRPRVRRRQHTAFCALPRSIPLHHGGHIHLPPVLPSWQHSQLNAHGCIESDVHIIAQKFSPDEHFSLIKMLKTACHCRKSRSTIQSINS